MKLVGAYVGKRKMRTPRSRSMEPSLHQPACSDRDTAPCLLEAACRRACHRVQLRRLGHRRWDDLGLRAACASQSVAQRSATARHSAAASQSVVRGPSHQRLGWSLRSLQDLRGQARCPQTVTDDHLRASSGSSRVGLSTVLARSAAHGCRAASSECLGSNRSRCRFPLAELRREAGTSGWQAASAQVV